MFFLCSVKSEGSIVEFTMDKNEGFNRALLIFLCFA